MIWRCDLSRQHVEFKDEVLPIISRVMESGVYVLGPELRSFEAEFAGYIGTSHCVGVANATDGLTLALMALDIGLGDEVITTPFTAIPTISAIIDAGAKPVFVDIDPQTYLLDTSKALSAVTPRTKAVMPVHIFGNVFDVAKLREELSPEIAIIEDAAQAHGANIRSAKAGSLAEIGVFSFYPTKNLGAYGDGGAVMTNSQELADKLRKLRMFGMVDKDNIELSGINSRLDELQAALLRVKLRRLDKMNEQRRVIAQRYKAGLPPEHFTYQKFPDNVVGNYHVFVAEAPDGKRDALIKYLAEHDIQTNVYYPFPQSQQKALAKLGCNEFQYPIASQLCKKVIALPMYPEFPETEQLRVIETIKSFFAVNE